MLIIDRFEGEFAVCEDDGRKMRTILRDLLPENACEGDVLVSENGKLRIDEAETKARREQAAALLKRLKKK